MKLLQKIDQWATKKNTIVAFILWGINGILLTLTDEMLKRFSSVPKLDFHLQGYNAEYVTSLFTTYGSSGREAYFWMTILDVPLPFVACLFCTLLYARTFRTWNMKWLANILIVAAFSFLLFDNLENICLFTMMKVYPNISSTLAATSSLLTQIKLCSVIIIYGFLPITLIVWIIRQLKIRMKQVS